MLKNKGDLFEIKKCWSGIKARKFLRNGWICVYIIKKTGNYLNIKEKEQEKEQEKVKEEAEVRNEKYEIKLTTPGNGLYNLVNYSQMLHLVKL